MKSDRYFLGLLVALAGAFLMATSFQYAALPGQAYGAGTMPRIVGFCGMLLGLALVLDGRRQGEARQRFAAAGWLRGRLALSVLAVLLAVLLYIPAAPLVGFMPASAAILLALMLLGGIRWPLATIIALVAAVVIYFAFSRLLLVPLPRGPVESLF